MFKMIKAAMARGHKIKRLRQEMDALGQMDARTLRDIGLTQGDVIAARRRLRYWI